MTKAADAGRSKGMLFFTILYHVMGEKEFMDAAGTFYQKFNKSGATTEEFLDHINQRSGQKLDRLFDEWIFGTESSRLILENTPFEDLVQRYRQ